MPRREISMSAAEIAAFLATRAEVVVVASDVEGPPTAAVGRLQFDGGAVGFTLLADDPVVDHLEHDDRVCCVAEQFPSYFEIRGVMLHGHARRTDVASDGVRYSLDVVKTLSFDFAKLPRE